MTESVEIVFTDELAEEIEAFAAEHEIETPMETVIQLVRTALNAEKGRKLRVYDDGVHLHVRMPIEMLRHIRIAAAKKDRSANREILSRIKDVEGLEICTSRCAYDAGHRVVGFSVSFTDFVTLRRCAKAANRSVVMEVYSRLAFSVRRDSRARSQRRGDV